MAPPPADRDERLSHGRVIFTLLVVMGTVQWSGFTFVVFKLPPAMLAGLGTIGAAAGAWLAGAGRHDLRRGETAIAGALAVLFVAGLGELYGSAPLDGPGKVIVLGGAFTAGLAGWLGLRVRTDEDVPGLIRVLLVGTISLATVALLFGALIALREAHLLDSAEPVMLLMLGVLGLGGIIALALVPGCRAVDVFLGQLLIVTVGLLVRAVREDAEVVAVVIPFFAAILALPGTVSAAIVAAWGPDFSSVRPRPRGPDLPEARSQRRPANR